MKEKWIPDRSQYQSKKLKCDCPISETVAKPEEGRMSEEEIKRRLAGRVMECHMFMDDDD